MITGLDCTVEIACAINLSESQQKIEQAITNIFLECIIRNENYSIITTSNDIKSLEKIRESIQSNHSQKTYLRIIQKHIIDNSTWFYLNKQAAFAKKIVICEEADESPLGPIKVTISSNNLERIIDWLCN